LETVRGNDLQTVRVHDGLGFRLNSIKLGQQSEDCWFGFNDVNTIPLQLQINFTELREDICGLWQPRYCIYDTLWQPPSVCSSMRTNSLYHYPSAPHCL